MTYFNPESANVNVKLSVEMIKEFVNAFPPEGLTTELLEKKRRADAALEHLTGLFDYHPGNESTDDPEYCGPKPMIPNVPF
jgi:hypothetical protein